MKHLLSMLIAFAIACGPAVAADHTPLNRDGLLLEYPLAKDVNDTSGGNFHGKVHGNPAFADVEGRAGLVFDGVGDWVEAAANLPALGDEFTIECWVKPAAQQAVNANIFGNHENSVTGEALGVVLQQDGGSPNRYAFSYGTGAGGFIATKPIQLAADRWQHIAIVKTPQDLSFYLNGERMDTVPATSPVVPRPSSFRIGLGFPLEDRCFRGAISEFRIWNRALDKIHPEVTAEQKAEAMANNTSVSLTAATASRIFDPANPPVIEVGTGDGALDTASGGIQVNFECVNLAGEKTMIPTVELTAANGFKQSLRLTLPPGFYSLTSQPTVPMKNATLKASTLHFSVLAESASKPAAANSQTKQTFPLDGANWLLAPDPGNIGVAEKWFQAPVKEAKPATVPGNIQSVFRDYHGVAWYWLDFQAPLNPNKNGRYLIKFQTVDYKADVWVNGMHLMTHEGIESPFEVDATQVIKPGETNRLAVRVLNVTTTPIDGLSLANVPVGYKTNSYTPGYFYNDGGITASVALEITPSVFVRDIFARPNIKTGEVEIDATVVNTNEAAATARINYTARPTLGGTSASQVSEDRKLEPGVNIITTTLKIENPVLWDLENPFLYTLQVGVRQSDSPAIHEASVRFGLREFRFEKDAFALNGKKLMLRAVITVPCFPGKFSIVDKELLRREVTNLKAMGFNAVRHVIGVMPTELLDLYDEMGVLVFREGLNSVAPVPAIAGGFGENSHALHAMDSQKRQRWINTWAETFARDRNHPSIVVWGLLNETAQGDMLALAKDMLPLVRHVDSTRIALLNSGMSHAVATTDNKVSDLNISPNTNNLSNAGSNTWDSLLNDSHLYQPLPLTKVVADNIRTVGSTAPLLITESGTGSSNHLINTVRNFEQMGAADAPDALWAQAKLDQFMTDWEKWNLSETWARPEEFFNDSWENLAKIRIDLANAFRANPTLTALFICAMHDHAIDGVGVITFFRDVKTGNFDAMTNANAPLRWSLFAEPAQLYSGKKIKLEALLSNDGILTAGTYPVRFQVLDPQNRMVFEKQVEMRIREIEGSPFVTPVLSEEVFIDGPSGAYQFLATLEKGGYAKADRQTFHVTRKTDMPPVPIEAVLWGEDAPLSQWLGANGIKSRPYVAGVAGTRELILVSTKAFGTGTLAEFTELASRIAQGSSAVFLSADVFHNKSKPPGVDGPLAPFVRPLLNLDFAPFARKGFQADINCCVGYYRKDDWAKNHPIFAGMPAGGIMNMAYYKNLIPYETVMMNIQPPDEAVSGAINASLDYASGLHVGVYKLGAGRFILNNLQILENLGTDPAAERLLRNMLNYAARDLDQPLAELPADFDQQLKAIGYE